MNRAYQAVTTLVRRTGKKKHFLPAIARVLVLTFTTNIAFATKPEINLWKERRKENPVQLASLPSGLQPQLQNLSRQNLNQELIKQTPSLQSALNEIGKTIPHKITQSKIISEIPESFFSHVNLRDSYKGTQPLSVVILEDVHLNKEAQTHLSKAIKSFGDTSGETPVLVGLEGAEGKMLFDDWKSLPKRNIAEAVADSFFDSNEISGPAHAGFTSYTNAGTRGLQFWGVDQMTLHANNIAAYKNSKSVKAQLAKMLFQEKLSIQKEKDLTFNPTLKAFDEKIQQYRAGTLSLFETIQTLTSLDVSPSINIETFVQAAKMEKSFDFKRVEEERTAVLEKLAKNLNEKDLNALINLSLGYQQGMLTFAEYFNQLKMICEHHNIDLKATPEFNKYIQYVLLADGIKTDSLFKEIKTLEEKAFAILATTEAERALVKTDRALYLTSLLSEFSLTNDQWEEYKEVRGSQFVVRGNLFSRTTNYAQRTASLLSPFEAFYETAEMRSRAMINNLLNKETNEHRQTSSVAVLVSGGFHTSDFIADLKNRHISYVVASPKISKIEIGEDTHFLSVFDREKTTLEKIFNGQKLFLVSPPAGSVGNPINTQMALEENLLSEMNPSNVVQKKSVTEGGIALSEAAASIESLPYRSPLLWTKAAQHVTKVGIVIHYHLAKEWSYLFKGFVLARNFLKSLSSNSKTNLPIITLGGISIFNLLHGSNSFHGLELFGAAIGSLQFHSPSHSRSEFSFSVNPTTPINPSAFGSVQNDLARTLGNFPVTTVHSANGTVSSTLYHIAYTMVHDIDGKGAFSLSVLDPKNNVVATGELKLDEQESLYHWNFKVHFSNEKKALAVADFILASLTKEKIGNSAPEINSFTEKIINLKEQINFKLVKVHPKVKYRGHTLIESLLITVFYFGIVFGVGFITKYLFGWNPYIVGLTIFFLPVIVIQTYVKILSIKEEAKYQKIPANQIRRLLEISEINQYFKGQTSENLKKWLNYVYEEDHQWILDHLLLIKNGTPSEKQKAADTLNESFFKTLTPGTAGIRGSRGIGPGKINKFTVGYFSLAKAKYFSTPEFRDLIKKADHEFKIEDPIAAAVGFDNREGSDEIAKRSALLNLVKGKMKVVYFYPEGTTTPQLSWTVRELNHKLPNVAPIRIVTGEEDTASHNPSTDTGEKVYQMNGSQMTGAFYEGIMKQYSTLKPEAMEGVTYDSHNLFGTKEELEAAFQSAVKNGDIVYLNEEVDDAFIHSQMEESHAFDLDGTFKPDHLKLDNVAIFISPLHGMGRAPIEKLLKRRGIKPSQVTWVQDNRDPKFSTVKDGKPNPELPAAKEVLIQKMIEAAQQGLNVQGKILMGILVDPDVDRPAVLISKSDPLNPNKPLAVNSPADLVSFNGNQQLALLADYSVTQLARTKTIVEKGGFLNSRHIFALNKSFALNLFITTNISKMFAATTVVSGFLMKDIFRGFGMTVFETLTGFKYIGDLIEEFTQQAQRRSGLTQREYKMLGKLDRKKILSQHSKAFFMGGEESLGLTTGDTVHDKNAVTAVSWFIEMVGFWNQHGTMIDQRMNQIYAQYGYLSEPAKMLEFDGKLKLDSGSEIKLGEFDANQIIGKLDQDKKRPSNYESDTILGALRSRTNINSAHPITEIAGKKIKAVIDYYSQEAKDTEGQILFSVNSDHNGFNKDLNFYTFKHETGQALPKEDFVTILFEDGSTLIARPSGTEPKIKFYVLGRGEYQDKQKVDEWVEKANKWTASFIKEIAAKRFPEKFSTPESKNSSKGESGFVDLRVFSGVIAMGIIFSSKYFQDQFVLGLILLLSAAAIYLGVNTFQIRAAFEKLIKPENKKLSNLAKETIRLDKYAVTQQATTISTQLLQISPKSSSLGLADISSLSIEMSQRSGIFSSKFFDQKGPRRRFLAWVIGFILDGKIIAPAKTTTNIVVNQLIEHNEAESVLIIINTQNEAKNFENEIKDMKIPENFVVASSLNDRALNTRLEKLVEKNSHSIFIPIDSTYRDSKTNRIDINNIVEAAIFKAENRGFRLSLMQDCLRGADHAQPIYLMTSRPDMVVAYELAITLISNILGPWMIIESNYIDTIIHGAQEAAEAA